MTFKLIEINHVPDGLEVKQIRDFLQKMYYRIIQGRCRYGAGSRFIPRLDKELATYKRTGNAEHLYNIANYALLESIRPEHPKFHFDNTVDSVTRTKKSR